MNAEAWLRERFTAAARRLPDPPDRLSAVVRQGRRRRLVQRGAIVLGAAAAVAAVPIALSALSGPAIELAPAGPIVETEATAPVQTPSDERSPDATGAPSPDQQAPDHVAAVDLRSPVLAYGPDEQDRLRLVDGDDERLIWSGAVDVALPDGQGGVVLQPRAEPAIVWLPNAEEEGQVRLTEVTAGLLLRGVLPDGRVVYSMRPDDETLIEGEVEEFFAVDLAEGAQPELVGSRPAYESWHVGPVAAAGGELVHAGCHLQCTLWPGLADVPEGAEPRYEGLAIEGLTATPDGGAIAFIEFDPAVPDQEPTPELVVLDGASFEELARIELPLEPEQSPGQPTVSLSADGQRILVALGSAGQQPVPTTPYLVEDALTDEPSVRRVDADGALRWADPATSGEEG
ncbi:MAG: hypothetical protein GEU81_15915 [Nitriliruptorales bacterium]|nr:hypothetical protein [Nitriliruptorales bacterium]